MRITFPVFLIVTVVFGLGLGASYGAGIVTERARNGRDLPRLEALRPPGAEARPGGAGAGVQGTTGGPGGFGQRGAGEASLESLFGTDARPIAQGTVEGVSDGQITLRTANGQAQVRLQDGAKVARVVNGTDADLAPGLRVIIIGQRQEDGTLVASRILLPLPSGATRD